MLPRIPSKVSLSLIELEGDPLGDWLASISKFRALPESLLVLPAHGEPFHGLHARLDRLETGHLESLDRLHVHLKTAPRRAVDCFGGDCQANVAASARPYAKLDINFRVCL